MEIARIENLSKSYGSGNTKVEALKNINLTINQGEFLAVVGPSGSGKSTLLHLLGGVDKPTSGKVYVDGVDIYSLSEKELAIFRRRKVGFIFQFYNLVPVLTAEENILLPILLDSKKYKQRTCRRTNKHTWITGKKRPFTKSAFRRTATKGVNR